MVNQHDLLQLVLAYTYFSRIDAQHYILYLWGRLSTVRKLHALNFGLKLPNGIVGQLSSLSVRKFSKKDWMLEVWSSRGFDMVKKVKVDFEHHILTLYVGYV